MIFTDNNKNNNDQSHNSYIFPILKSDQFTNFLE